MAVLGREAGLVVPAQLCVALAGGLEPALAPLGSWLRGSPAAGLWCDLPVRASVSPSASGDVKSSLGGCWEAHEGRGPFAVDALLTDGADPPAPTRPSVASTGQ